MAPEGPSPEGRPLEGVRVVVTRAENRSGSLGEALEARGARVELLPLIEIVPPDDPRPFERAMSELALYRWLVLTSMPAVEAVEAATGGALPAGLRVAAIGPATAEAIRELRVEPALVPRDVRAEGLLAELAPRLGRQERVLLPQAADARSVLADGLREAGCDLVTVVAYDKRLPADAPTRAARIFGAGPTGTEEPMGWVTFTSPSTAKGLASILGPAWVDRREGLRAASIGAVTTAALRRLGVEPEAEAATPGIEGLVDAIVEAHVVEPAP